MVRKTTSRNKGIKKLSRYLNFGKGPKIRKPGNIFRLLNKEEDEDNEQTLGLQRAGGRLALVSNGLAAG